VVSVRLVGRTIDAATPSASAAPLRKPRADPPSPAKCGRPPSWSHRPSTCFPILDTLFVTNWDIQIHLSETSRLSCAEWSSGAPAWERVHVRHFSGGLWVDDAPHAATLRYSLCPSWGEQLRQSFDQPFHYKKQIKEILRQRAVSIFFHCILNPIQCRAPCSTCCRGSDRCDLVSIWAVRLDCMRCRSPTFIHNAT
jgi:hypothetical protein